MAELVPLPASPRPRRQRKRPARVITADMVTLLNVPPDRVLKAAQGRLDSVLLVGWDKAGDFYFAASFPDGADALWLMELARQELLRSAHLHTEPGAA